MQTVADKLTKRTPNTLFKNLIKKAEQQTRDPVFDVKSKPEYSQFLILNILKEGSKELITIAENINPNGPVDEKKLELFRGSFSTAVTGTFFSELLNSVEGSVDLLSKKQKKSSNILEQYNFYMILILLRTSMMCLSKLNIPISSLLYERNDFDRLVKIVEQNISVMVSKEAIDYTIEEGNAHEELQCLWSAIENECRSIMSYCLSLVYESLEDLMRKVTSLLEKMDVGTSDNSLGIYINYLTLPETMNKALKSNEIKDLILVIYEKLCILKTKKLVLAIDSIKYDAHQHNDVEYSSLEISNEGFIYAVTQNVINLYFEAYRDVEKQKEQSKADKEKLEILERKLERTEFDLIKVLERISESTIQILDKCAAVTQYYMDEAIKQQKEDDKIEEQDKKPKLTGKMKYVQFHRHLHKIAHLNNNFPSLMHVYVAAFASLKDSTNVKTLSLLSIKILKVIETFSKFKEIVSDDLTLSESEDLFRNHLDKDIIKFFVWTISKLSYSFISVKKVAEPSEEEKMNKKILDSKLLSGGIENRFLPILSKDTVNSLRDLCEITADKTIKQYLQSEPKELDEDQVFMSIIYQGKDKNIDRVIDLLQFNMERKHPWAKSAKEEGMRLSRAAFACMIKIGQLYTDFIMMVDETEMNADSITTDDENAAKKELAKELSKIDSYDTIFKHWESSAKMRSWYQEKKKSWANKIKKEEEEKKKKDSTEEKPAEENKDKPKDVKEEQKTDVEEVIDTTSKPVDDSQPKKKTRDQVELAKIIDKVVEKAELLIKLSMPTLWDNKDQAKLNVIETIADEEERKLHSGMTSEEIPDWKQRLDKWREIQESAGTVIKTNLDPNKKFDPQNDLDKNWLTEEKIYKN